MKKPDLIKQLANRINQPHVIESWINKIEKAAYNKGYKDAESKQCNIGDVSISLERAKKYARHQHFLGTEGSELVEFEDWTQD